MKLMQRPQTQIESMNNSRMTDQSYYSQSNKEGKQSSQKVMKYSQQ